MDSLVQFLESCLDEDKADALAAIADRSETARWEAHGWLERGRMEWIVRDAEEKYASYGYPGHTAVAAAMPGGPRDGGGVAAHIARHDPARVLREVAAKRAILEDYTTTCRIRDEAAERIKEAQASGQYVAADYETWERANREASLLDGVVQHLLAIYADRPGYQEAWKPVGAEPMTAPAFDPTEYWATLRKHEQEARDPVAKDRHADMWKAPEEGEKH